MTRIAVVIIEGKLFFHVCRENEPVERIEVTEDMAYQHVANLMNGITILRNRK